MDDDKDDIDADVACAVACAVLSTGASIAPPVVLLVLFNTVLLVVCAGVIVAYIPIECS